MPNKIIAIVGMPGSGKTDVSEYFVKNNYQFLRFGQLTLDEVKKQNLLPTEENERKIREAIRKEHGMDAYAKLNAPRIDDMLSKGNVVIDGLRSFAEYTFLKEKYNDRLVVLSIYASPKTRYKRLSTRKLKKDDKDMKKRPATIEEAKARDKAEIENLHIGGSIAMADYTIVNEGSRDELKQNIEKLCKILK